MKPKAAAAKTTLKDPKGGLTAAGRKHFKETEGAHLKPGVKSAADTPEKMKRKVRSCVDTLPTLTSVH